MKYIFASDIHGSAYYCRKLLNVFEHSGAEQLILMGDLLYHGARNDLPEEYGTKDCTQQLNEYAGKIIACRGNCDSEIDQMVLQFPIMSDYNLLNLNGITFFQTHGHLYNPEKLPPMGVCRAFVFGHIHLPVARRQGDVYILNPGSTSIPKGGFPNSYAVLDDNVWTVKDFEGNEIKSMVIE
ncbi:MAG: phosphodiesterase [Lachnospiraceae bacterium]|nr:phosphodiesterase [Candidatus Darwinimomas equi]